MHMHILHMSHVRAHAHDMHMHMHMHMFLQESPRFLPNSPFTLIQYFPRYSGKPA